MIQKHKKQRERWGRGDLELTKKERRKWRPTEKWDWKEREEELELCIEAEKGGRRGRAGPDLFVLLFFLLQIIDDIYIYFDLSLLSFHNYFPYLCGKLWPFSQGPNFNFKLPINVQFYNFLLFFFLFFACVIRALWISL